MPTRLLAARWVAALCLVLAAPAPRARASATDLRFHVRSSDRWLGTLVEDGVRTSPTLQALVDRLMASDVIVFVQCDRMGPSHIAGRLTFVTAAGGYRYVVVRMRRLGSRPHQMALLAHELQHAVEIAGAPSIVDQASLGRAYEEIGYANRRSGLEGRSFDTDEAVRVGVKVLTELLDGE